MSDKEAAQVDSSKINRQIIELLRDEDFNSLVKRSQRINSFSVIGMENQEIKHSNFLAWLLDPGGSHQLGDSFVKEILVNVLLPGGKVEAQKNKDSSMTESSTIEKILDNYDDAIVTRETDDNIDILFRTQDKRLIICIENKVWASLSPNQLDKYYDYVKKRYGDYPDPVFIFLTPSGMPVPEIYSRHYNEWLPLSYEAIRQSLERLCEQNLSIKTKMLIEDYIDLLERNGIVEADSLDGSINKLYHRYKDVFDLIDERKGKVKDQIRLHLIEIYNEVLEGLKQERVISDYGAEDESDYRWFKTERMNNFLPRADSEGLWGDGSSYNYCIYPFKWRDEKGLFHPKIALELSAIDQDDFIMNRINQLNEENPEKCKLEHNNGRLYKHIMPYWKYAGFDLTAAVTLDDIDDDEVKRKTKGEILKMLEFEDRVLDKLEGRAQG